MSKRRRRILWFLGALAGVAAIAAIAVWWLFDGPASKYALFEEYERKYQPKVEMFDRISKIVDSEPEVVKNELRTNPKGPLVTFGETANCDMANDWEIRTPFRYQTVPCVEVMSLGPSVTNTNTFRVHGYKVMHWSGPAEESTRKWLERGLNVDYLAVVRQREYGPLDQREDGTRSGGLAKMECFVFDQRTTELVGKLALTIRVPQNLELKPEPKYLASQGEDTVQYAARKWLGEATRALFGKQLERLSAGPTQQR